VGVYTRETDSGGVLECWFCRECGGRVVHVGRGRDGETKKTVSVKGGCLEGLGAGKLDLRKAVHIWCKRAVVEIPEGVERWEGEPEE